MFFPSHHGRRDPGMRLIYNGLPLINKINNGEGFMVNVFDPGGVQSQ